MPQTEGVVAGPGCERCEGGLILVVGRDKSWEETCPKCGPKPAPRPVEPQPRAVVEREFEYSGCGNCGTLFKVPMRRTTDKLPWHCSCADPQPVYMTRDEWSLADDEVNGWWSSVIREVVA